MLVSVVNEVGPSGMTFVAKGVVELARERTTNLEQSPSDATR